MKLDVNSLAHTKWECKYHIVFAPKYRRQIIYGKIKQDIGQMLRKLCEYKGIEIHEAEACKDHIHMLVSIPPKYSVSQIMGYLKGKSSLMTVSYTHLDVYKRQLLGHEQLHEQPERTAQRHGLRKQVADGRTLDRAGDNLSLIHI